MFNPAGFTIRALGFHDDFDTPGVQVIIHYHHHQYTMMNHQAVADDLCWLPAIS